MTAEIRVTRKGIVFFLLLNIILMYMISGRGCKNYDSAADSSQQNVVIQQPVEEETQSKNDGQGQDQKNNQVEQKKLNLPIIYAITPTYARPLQKAELTR